MNRTEAFISMLQGNVLEADQDLVFITRRKHGVTVLFRYNSELEQFEYCKYNSSINTYNWKLVRGLLYFCKSFKLFNQQVF